MSLGTTIIITEPTVEPVSLSEFKDHIRLDSGTFADNTDNIQSIYSGSHAIAASYTLLGEWIEVIGYDSIVYLVSGPNGSGGTVDAKIQESDDATTPNDWPDGDFTQVTESNDNATQEKAYTGTKRYIRVVSTVAVAACEFGAEVLRKTSIFIEDDLISKYIKAARLHVEKMTNRKFITQTWEYYLKQFPSGDYIDIPFGNLQSITSIIYKNSEGTETTMVVDTEYIVELNGKKFGRAVLAYGTTWPSFTPFPSKPITIKFVCGYGDAGIDVDENINTAIKMVTADLYVQKGDPTIGTNITDETVNKLIDRLLASEVLRWEQRDH